MYETVIETVIVLLVWLWFAIGLWMALKTSNGDPAEDQIWGRIVYLGAGPIGWIWYNYKKFFGIQTNPASSEQKA